VPIVGWVADRAIDRHHGDWLGWLQRCGGLPPLG